MSNFRITTNGLYRNYRTNLYKNNKKLTDSMLGVETQRKFNTYAEDPAAASKAWRLRRSYWRTGDQIDNSNYILSKYESAYSAMGAVIDGDVGNGEYGMGLDAILSAVKGATGSAGASRAALGKELSQAADNIVSMMNGKYGDEHIFAGADGANIPFRWSDDGTKLLYRSIDVTTEEPKLPADFGLTGGADGILEKYHLTSKVLGDDYNKEYINLESAELDQPLSREAFIESKGLKPENYGSEADYNAAVNEQYTAYKKQYVLDNKASSDGNAVKLTTALSDPPTDAQVDAAFAEAQGVYDKLKAFQNYAKDYATRNGRGYEAAATDYAKLRSMTEEATYVDIGLGMAENEDGELLSGSAFNSAISGLSFLGYGEDKNLVMIVKELGEIFSNADPDTGVYANEDDSERVDKLLNSLQDAVRSAQDQHTQLSADAKYLKTNLNQLQTVKAELDKQIVDTEDMEMGDAITNMTWAQYCYNAALRIGTNILSQSLIDYMS